MNNLTKLIMKKITFLSSILLCFLFFTNEYSYAQCNAAANTASGSGGNTVYMSSVWFPTESDVFAGTVNSGTGSYTDRTGLGSRRTLKQGFFIQPDNRVLFGVPHSAAGVVFYCAVYVDVNRNGQFEASEKLYSQMFTSPFAGLTSVSSVLNLPTNASPGTARMRIMVKHAADVTGPCETGFNGEVEDFLVTLEGSASTAPTVSSSSATSVTSSGATLNGNVTADGGATISERGFVYSLTSTDSSPTVAESSGSNVTKVVVSGTTGSFNRAISSLLPNTGYSFAPYAINSEGTTHGTTRTFTTSKASQTITFSSLANKSFGAAPFILTATASSGLGVTYSSSNTAVASVSGSTVTVVGVGSTTITASQAGNTSYNAATNVQQTLTVTKASQTITFGALASKAFGDSSFSLSATASSGLGVTYASSNTAVATVSGSTVTIVGAGSTTITASQAGNTNYNAATNVPQTLTVGKSNQSITFGTLASKTFGDASFSLTGTASSGLGVTYASSNTAVATVSGSTVTIVGAGSTTITASQVGNTNYNAATNVPQTLTVGKSNQTITFGALASKTFGDASFSLTGTASSGLGVTYTSSNTAVATVSGSTVTIVGAGSTTITASQTGNTNYNAATNVPQTLTVGKSNQTITFGALASKTFGNSSFSLTGTASSGLGVTYASSNTAVATVSGSTVTIVGAGSTTITVSQAGNTNYNAATNIPQTLTVNKAALTVTANAGQGKVYGATDPTLTYTITGFVSGDVEGDLDTSVSISRVAGEDVGNYTITPSGAADTNYTVSFVTSQFGITTAALTVTANASQTKVYGDTDPTLTYTITGFVNGETEGNLDTGVSISRASGEDVGNYTITPSGATDSNYAVSFVTAQFSITKATLTATAEANSKTYGDANPAFTITYTGFKGSDNVSVLDTAPTASSTADGTTNVGTATITPSGGSDNNYTFSYANGTLTIDKRPITVSVDIGLAKVIGGTDPALTYQVTVGTVVNGNTPTGALTRTAGEFPGTFPITIGTLSYGANYNVTFVGRNFTIAFTITTGIAAAAASTAAIVGESTSQPGIIERGVVYSSIDTTPEVGETNVTKVVGPLTGPFNVTISGLDPNTTYYFQTYVISSTSRGGKIVPDTYYGGIKSFITALTEPAANSYSPLDGSTLVAPTTNLTINFDQDIQEGAGNIEIRKVSDDSLIESIDISSANIDICGSDLTIDPSADLPQLTDVYILIPVGVIQNLSGDNWPGIFTKTVWNFGTDDTVAPMVTATSPLDDATNVPPADNLTVTFNENVVKGTGNILVKAVSDDSVIATLDVTSSEVSISNNVVTINPNTDLPGGVAMYIEVASGVFEDQYNNAYAGIAGNSAWNFTTSVIETSFDTTSSDGLESVSSINIPVSLSVPVSVTATVNYTVTGTATGSGTDYTLANGTVTFVPGDQNETITIAGIVDDTILETNETIILTLSNPVNTTLGANTMYTYTINNNDVASVTIANVSANEDDGNITVTATLDNAVQGGFTVDVSTADGTATTADSDYTAVTNETLTFTGSAGETQTFTITPTVDTKLEANETLTITQTNLLATTLAVDITDGATVTLTNDDTASITIADVSANEDDGNITVTATLDNAVQGGFTVDVNTADGTGTTGDSDYTAVTSETLTFTGSAGETQTFTITPTADTKLEANETLTVSQSNLSATTLAVVITDGATVTINNDDTASITIADVSANEDDGNITVTATLDNAVQAGFTVDVSTADGTATTADSDYIAVTNETLTFTGSAGETQTFTITPTVDTKLEANETLIITQTNLLATTLAVVITDEATVTITNDDNASVTISDVRGNENDGVITVTATLDNAVQAGFSLDVSSANGSATTADNDYTALISETLSFVGTAGETQTFTITPTADIKVEIDEVFFVNQSNLAGTTLAVDITDGAIVTIDNDDSTTITLSDATVVEADGSVSIIATLDNPVQNGFTLKVSTVDGTAVGASDFTALSDYSIFFTGTASETKSIMINITDDMVGEEIEIFTVVQSSISVVRGADIRNDIIITDTATITITDDDAPVVTNVSVPADELYGIGDVLDFTVTFTNAATTTGTPSIPITIGSTTVEATLKEAITSSLTAIFSYTIVEDNLDADGISVGSAISLNGGTIVGITSIPAILDLNGVANSSNVIIDGVKPTLVITTNAADPTNVGFTATFTFSEGVTGFDMSDIAVGNGTASAFNTTSSSVYTALITPTADGDVTIDVAADVAQDAASNDNKSATQYSVLYDATNPTVAITTNAPDPVNTPFDITVTFSEDVTGFELADLAVTNGTASAFVATSASVYTATITPTADDDITVDIAAGASQDAATNPNDAAQFIIEYDSTPPVQPQVTHISDYTCVGNVAKTGDNTLMISGVAERGSTVEMFLDGASIGTTTAGASNGFFTYDYTATVLADGTYNFTVTATDVANNTSTLSNPLTITIDSLDTDGDGLPDFCDDDDDGNGVDDVDEDCDGDGIVDHLDTDNSSCSNTITQVKTYGFSPNGDGINEGWVIENITSFPNNTVQVFNRSGKLVFKKKGYQNDWQGISNQISSSGLGTKLPVGPYLFIIDLGDGSKPTRGWLYINY